MPYKSDHWPFFNPGPSPDHLHAIGVCALVFSSLEGSFDRLYFALSDAAKVPRELAEYHYFSLDEQKRNEAMRKVSSIALGETEAKEVGDNAIECFCWCRRPFLSA
jgi:hypothetical protein